MDFIILRSGVIILLMSFLYSKQILAAIISIEGATVLVIIELLTLREGGATY